jgi:GlpG protein
MRVIKTSLEEDLSLFSRYLWQRQVVHRIFEERGQQILEVADASNVQQVAQTYEAWRSGKIQLSSEATDDKPPTATGFTRILRIWRDLPALSALLALSILVFPFSRLVSAGELTAVAGLLTIVDLTQPGPLVWHSVFTTLELWRLLTPIFLHFSVIHIAFNCVVVFELGRRVETVNGTMWFCAVVVVLGVLSNLGQFLLHPSPLFGGLSGVAYGLLGYILVSSKRFPAETMWQLRPGFAISLLIFLVLFTTGVTEFFGLAVANAAHWSGLVAGGAMALLAPAVERR